MKTMDKELVAIKINIYPGTYMQDVWEVPAYVYGIWAVHDAHADEPFWNWSITHIPSGATSFVAQDLEVAKEAARRLAAIEEPQVEVIGGKKIKPISIEWIGLSADAVADLDIMAVAGSNIIPVGNLAAYAKSRRSRA